MSPLKLKRRRAVVAFVMIVLILYGLVLLLLTYGSPVHIVIWDKYFTIPLGKRRPEYHAKLQEWRKNGFPAPPSFGPNAAKRPVLQEDINMSIKEDIQEFDQNNRLLLRTRLGTKEADTDEIAKDIVVDKGDDDDDGDDDRAIRKRVGNSTKKLSNPLLKGLIVNNPIRRSSDKKSNKIGLYPTKIGTVFANRYEVIKYLGDGVSCEVWMCVDRHTGGEVALKITRYLREYQDIIHHELKVLHDVQMCPKGPNNGKGKGHITTVLDNFELPSVSDPLRNHTLLVFEVNGMHVGTLRSLFTVFPIPVLKNIARQLLLGLDYLHNDCHMWHGDLKVANIIINADRDDGCQTCLSKYKMVGSKASNDPCIDCKVKIADLGSTYFNRRDDHSPFHLHTAVYRAPEVIIGGDFSDKSDVWAVACILWQLACRRQLFPAKEPSKNKNQLAQIVGLLGEIPTSINGSRRSMYFDHFGTLRENRPIRRQRIIPFLRTKCGFDLEEAISFNDFLMFLLRLDPAQRVDSHQALRLPWLEDLTSTAN